MAPHWSQACNTDSSAGDNDMSLEGAASPRAAGAPLAGTGSCHGAPTATPQVGASGPCGEINLGRDYSLIALDM